MSKEVLVNTTGDARGKLTRFRRTYVKPLTDSDDTDQNTLGKDGYMQWDMGIQIIRLDKGKKIFDVHIAFEDAKKKVKVFAKPGEDEGKVSLAAFPEGWTGSYDYDKGEITLEAPKDPSAPGYDPNKSLPKGSEDISFAFQPSSAKLGKVTVTFTDSSKKPIATSDGRESLD